MNSWIDIILNQKKFSRFLDREVTSALLGHRILKSINRLRTEVDADKLIAPLSEFVTDESFFNNFIYSALILFSLIEQKKMISIFNKVFEWIEKNIQREAFFNDGKNLVFASLLLHATNTQDDLKKIVRMCLEKAVKNQVRFDDRVYCYNNLRMALITIWIKVCEKLEGKPMPMQPGRTVDIGPLKKSLREHGLSGKTIGIISQTGLMHQIELIQKKEEGNPLQN